MINYGPSTTASPRIPYRAESTPPRANALHLHQPSPLRHNLPIPNDDYPESPTRNIRRLSTGPRSPELRIRPPPLSFNPKPIPVKTGKARYKVPRSFRTIRKALTCLILISLLVLISQEVIHRSPGITAGLSVGQISQLKARWLGQEWEEEEELQCRFVSTVEAYQRDLTRLRRTHQHHPSHLDLSLHTQSSPNTVTNTTTSHPPTHHTFSPTGHLHVSPSPSAPHPIPLLLTLGEKRWEELLTRQSRSLEEAVKEYTRRYNRRPPKGFDTWWEFAMNNDLVLPDEYDRINLDLAPFFALPKGEMKRRMVMVEGMKETFTLVVEAGKVEIQILDQGGLKWDGTLPRAQDAASLISGFAAFLPDMKATFSIFDQPQIYLSWARRESLVEMGLRGEHTTHLQETDSALVKLSRSCPPHSNLRSNATRYEGKSFIYDSLEASDPCQNPYVVPIHGLTIEAHTAESHPRPHTQLLPLFSLAKTSINSDILITPLDQFYDGPGRDPKWERKKSSKLAWRGSPTGISTMTKNIPWRQSHRVRLHNYANNRTFAPVSFLTPDVSSEEGIGDEGEDAESTVPAQTGPLGASVEEMDQADMVDFFFDMKLAGEPLQCDEDDGTCEDMAREIDWAPFQTSDDLNQHKFLLDIDGNGWSGRFRRLMSTNSVVIKSSLFTEWFQPHLIPWFMYIPAKLDFSDLPDILAFFRGTPKNPDSGFDETAKALAQNGQCFARRMFRLEDVQAYMMRLFLEYARIAADEGVDMDFHIEEMSKDETNERQYVDELTSGEVSQDVWDGKSDGYEAGNDGQNPHPPIGEVQGTSEVEYEEAGHDSGDIRLSDSRGADSAQEVSYGDDMLILHASGRLDEDGEWVDVVRSVEQGVEVGQIPSGGEWLEDTNVQEVWDVSYNVEE